MMSAQVGGAPSTLVLKLATATVEPPRNLGDQAVNSRSGVFEKAVEAPGTLAANRFWNNRISETPRSGAVTMSISVAPFGRLSTLPAAREMPLVKLAA